MPFGQFAATTQFYLYGKKYFTKTGWEAAYEKYKYMDLLKENYYLSEKVFIITGANDGIGFEVCSYLAHKDATVYMFCRNFDKAQQAQEKIFYESGNDKVHVILCDCSSQKSVRSAWNEFLYHREMNGLPVRLDGLLCNAGALLNELVWTDEGYETTLATHLIFGVYLLISLSLSVLQSTESSRVVVMSSGGMYNAKFPSWESIMCDDERPFDGQYQYAQCKRGQVILCEELSKKYPDVVFVSAHPGWVRTAGLERAYDKNMLSYLEPMRTVQQGSDGIIWLLVTDSYFLEPGGFYLDREPCVKHIAGPFFTEGSYTKNTREEISDMMEELSNCCAVNCAAELGDYVKLSEISRIVPKTSEPLRACSIKINIEQFMGTWIVQAHIPTIFDKGTYTVLNIVTCHMLQ
jgi:dehydrogenase/reductase SDR family member 12